MHCNSMMFKSQAIPFRNATWQWVITSMECCAPDPLIRDENLSCQVWMWLPGKSPFSDFQAWWIELETGQALTENKAWFKRRSTSDSQNLPSSVTQNRRGFKLRTPLFLCAELTPSFSTWGVRRLNQFSAANFVRTEEPQTTLDQQSLPCGATHQKLLYFKRRTFHVPNSMHVMLIFDSLPWINLDTSFHTTKAGFQQKSDLLENTTFPDITSSSLINIDPRSNRFWRHLNKLDTGTCRPYGWVFSPAFFIELKKVLSSCRRWSLCVEDARSTI